MYRNLIILCVVILLLFSMSCVTPTPTTTKPVASIVTETDKTQNDRITAIEGQQTLLGKTISDLTTGKASAQSVLDIETRLTGRINNIVAPTQVDAYPKAQTYTKTEVDSAVATAVNNAITALKSNQSWITVQPTPTPTPTPTGQVSIRVYTVAGPSTIVSSGGDYQIFLEVLNQTGSTKKLSLRCDLTPSSVGSIAVDNITMFSSINTAQYTISTMRSPSDLACSLIFAATSGIIFGSGTTPTILQVNLKMAYPTTTSATWNMVWSYSILP